MATIAVVGAGPLGGAIAHALAGRGRVSDLRLVDPEVRIAEGKALDLLQSSPVDQFSTRISAAGSVHASAGADVIVLADLVAGGEITGEAGLALLRQIAKVEEKSPFLFAGGSPRELMTRAMTELHVRATRLLGSAPLALESAVRAIAAAFIDGSPADVSLAVAGIPPHDAVIAWDAATAFNQPIARILAPHQLSAISARLPALWPPSTYTLASAAARIAEALALGSRRRWTCFAAVDVIGAGRNLIAAVPVQIVTGGVGKVLEPALSRHERTAFENGFSA
jgi:malate dehydrogenase